MKTINFYALNDTDKREIFAAVATEQGMTPFAVEKDWWVSRTLEIIFQMDIAEHLVFKGGTSLSKAWKLIHRFSEDIDLAIDRAFFEGYKGDLSKTQIGKLRKVAGSYTTGTFFEELKLKFEEKGMSNLVFKVVETGESDQDPRVLEIYYPNVVVSNSGYLLPRVQVEISCRSLREPYTIKKFGSLVDEFFSDKAFALPLFEVSTVNPERTLLEKLFLLHEEFQRSEEKMRVDRLSRHLYDVYHLTKMGVTEKAINDKVLYETIVLHRYQFSRVRNVDYNMHDPKMLNPRPLPAIVDKWKADYIKMSEDMIYEEDKPSFDDLIKNIEDIREKLQKLTWLYEVVLPAPKA